MSLNIKSEHVHDLARDVARRTGWSQTRAVEAALERYVADLDRQEAGRGVEAGRRRDEILADIRQRVQAAGSTALDTDDLYDDSGLPR